MNRDNRQILINPHSSVAKVPTGALNLGEIAVQHDSVSGASLYIETSQNSTSPDTVVRFMNASAVTALVESAYTDLQTAINAINESVGLPHDEVSGETHNWNSASTVWDAIEETWATLVASAAAATTTVEKGGQSEDWLSIDTTFDAQTSARTYTVSINGIGEAFSGLSAGTIQLSADTHNTIQQLSAGTIQLSADTYNTIQQLSGAVQDLDYTGVTPDGQAVVNVTQQDGKITVTQGNISAQTVYIADAGNLLTSSTVEQALQEIMNTVNANEVSSADKTVVITTASTGTDLSVNIDNETLVKDANGVIKADLEVVKLTAEEVAALQDATNVKEAYKLIYATDANRTVIGDVVKIYKDSALYNAYLGHVDDALVSASTPDVVSGSGDTALCFIYQKADGTYQLVAINVESFLEESEFSDGLQVNNHVVSVKVDATSERVTTGSATTEPVLTVSADGIKVGHIQDAIDYAVDQLIAGTDSEVSGASADNHVKVDIVQENTKLTSVTVTTNDIASEAELDNVEAAIGLTTAGTFTADTTARYISGASSVRGETKALDEALSNIQNLLGMVEVKEGASSGETWVQLNVAQTTAGTSGSTSITINDSVLNAELLRLSGAIDTEISARTAADDLLRGTETGSTSAETSLWGIKKLLDEVSKTFAVSVSGETGDTALVAVNKDEGNSGDTYGVYATNKLQSAVAAAENSVQRVEFASVSGTRTFNKPESGVGANITGDTNDKVLQLDMTLLRVDCGEY